MNEEKKVKKTLRELILEKIHKNPELIIDGFFDTPRGKFRWLSNFEPSPIEIDGLVYPTVEHSYQASKSLDIQDRIPFTQTLDPSWAKKQGQKLPLRNDWEVIKLDVMEQCLRQKFKPGTELANKLIATYPAKLVEKNWWNDKFYGVCNGNGLNNLGNLLEKIREELINGETKNEV